jgi:hypothetical protein
VYHITAKNDELDRVKTPTIDTLVDPSLLPTERQQQVSKIKKQSVEYSAIPSRNESHKDCSMESNETRDKGHELSHKYPKKSMSSTAYDISMNEKSVSLNAQSTFKTKKMSITKDS